jgi:hypothetical protein
MRKGEMYYPNIVLSEIPFIVTTSFTKNPYLCKNI